MYKLDIYYNFNSTRYFYIKGIKIKKKQGPPKYEPVKSLEQTMQSRLAEYFS